MNYSMLVASARVAFKSLLRSRQRSLLTSLGILIGIAAVIVVTALGSSARQQIGKEIEKLGSNVIFIWSRAAPKSGARVAVARPLTDQDAEALRREATALSGVTVWTQLKLEVSSREESASTAVMGVDRHYFQVRDVDVDVGRIWSPHEGNTKAKVVLIGKTVRDKLFGGIDPTGQIVRISGQPFRVIGMLEEKGQSAFEDQDDRILMPIGSWRTRVLPGLGNRVFLIMGQTQAADRTQAARRQIEAILRQRHQIAEGEESDFQIGSQQELQDAQQAVFGALTVLLISVAAIALFVGGVGVMNIMLVSVTERTREIGIRMAIGAKRADIQLQFLCEAVALALFGGLGGLLLALATIQGVRHATGWPLQVSVHAVLVGLGVSVAIGIVFGLLPARRASRLDPIEALRHE